MRTTLTCSCLHAHAASLLAIEAESVTEENVDNYLSTTETLPRRYVPIVHARPIYLTSLRCLPPSVPLYPPTPSIIQASTRITA